MSTKAGTLPTGKGLFVKAWWAFALLVVAIAFAITFAVAQGRSAPSTSKTGTAVTSTIKGPNGGPVSPTGNPYLYKLAREAAY